MQDIKTYQDAGWDFWGDIEDGLHEIWRMPDEGGYPVLAIITGYKPLQLQGFGTPEDPYLISDALELGAMIYYDPNAHYHLTKSIDLSGTRLRMALIPSFAGTFNGNGLTISNMTIEGDGNLGLFGWLEYGAEVRDLAVVDVNIIGSQFVGALAGENYGIVIRCCSTGRVTGDGYVGGLVGYNGGDVIACYSMGFMTGNEYVGGLAGYNSGSITCSYNTGTVSGSDCIGGLVGENDGEVTNCYSTGTVSGDRYVGGLVGSNTGSITTSYSTGMMNGSYSYSGGLVGSESDDGSVTSCFWDIQTSGWLKSAGGTGLTTLQMQDIQTYLDAGWDFIGEMENGLHEVWQIAKGSGYPIQAIFNGYIPIQLQGLGTSDEPYLVSDALELGTIVNYNPYAHFQLKNPIDLSGIRWATAVIPWFGGTFDGNGLTISNLTIEGSGNLGLFGQLKSIGIIKDLAVMDVNITASGECTGCLMGRNEGSIVTCYSTGAISSNGSKVGGLVGINYPFGTINTSYHIGSVTGLDNSGGLVGDNTGTLTQCYTTGSVSGESNVGGLVGSNDGGKISQCYSIDTVNGENNVGGLVGTNQFDIGVVTQSFYTGSVSGIDAVGGIVGNNTESGTVIRCYSMGTVTGERRVGGLVGWNIGSWQVPVGNFGGGGSSGSVWGTISNCYSTAFVSGSAGGGLVWGDGSPKHVFNCFWDTETSGKTNSEGGEGKTKVEMQTANTFLEAGWDFVDETANGTDDIWWIDEGNDYPRLWWELIPEN